MGTEWKPARLGDLVGIRHGWPFKSDLYSVDRLGRPIVVSIGNFQYTGGFRFDSTTIKEYAGEYPKDYELKAGDILLVMTCQTAGGEILGIPARVPDDGRVYLHNQRLGLVVPRSDDVDLRYLYWLFLSREFNQHLVSTASGTKILHTAPSRIESFTFRRPPLSTQRAIAHILDTLDDKIELNRRMKATLEAMARALFKSWFVEEPEAHWRTAPLADWVDVLSGGTPSKSKAALWGGRLKWISPKAMTSIHADECDDHVTEQAVGNGTRIAPKGSTLVMVRGMGLHDGVRVSQAREDVTFNQDVKALVPKHIEPDLLLFALLDAQGELHKRVETSGHGTGKMPSEILLAQPITMPPREVQRERVVHIAALNDRFAANRAESRSLAGLRDELLPRLLSGELRVDAADTALGGA